MTEVVQVGGGIVRWSDAGFSAEDARRWRCAGFGPGEASAWRATGLAPYAAKQWRDAGCSPGEAAARSHTEPTPPRRGSSGADWSSQATVGDWWSGGKL
jgi:hypothetical protein